MKEYTPRICDDILKFRLDCIGAVLIEGAKYCGKTTTAEHLAGSVLRMHDADLYQQNIEVAKIAPTRLLDGKPPRLIDEWQLFPRLWDAVRSEVDKRGETGQFILTGSAVPADMSDVLHTGTGRIARMRMRPMSLYESGESTGAVSLAKLFEGERKFEGECTIDAGQMAFLIARGGWPSTINRSERAALQHARDYVDAVVELDISRVDGIERDPARAARLLRSYARVIGSQAKFSSIAADISANEASAVSDKTISSYINALRKIFVLEEASAWTPNLRSKTAIRTTETRYFTDPSIGVAALGLGPRDLLNDMSAMGLFFENLAVRDLRVYADALDGKVEHFLDKNGLECDAIVHLRNGAYGLIEIKLGDYLVEEGARTLEKLASKIDTTKMPPPAFKMVLTGVGRYAYCREDGILVVPIGCLRP